MLKRLRGLQSALVGPVVRLLLRLGVRPDAVTWFGAVSVTVTALTFFPRGWLWQGSLVIGLLCFSDLIDGEMARESGTTSRWGNFLDASLDRVADAAVLGGIAWWLGLNVAAEWAVLAVWALVAAQATSYVKARAEAVGCTADVGLVARADRLVLALLGALLAGLGVAYALQTTVLVLAIGGTITVAQRFFAVRRQLRPGGAAAGGSSQVPT